MKKQYAQFRTLGFSFATAFIILQPIWSFACAKLIKVDLDLYTRCMNGFMYAAILLAVGTMYCLVRCFICLYKIESKKYRVIRLSNKAYRIVNREQHSA